MRRTAIFIAVVVATIGAALATPASAATESFSGTATAGSPLTTHTFNVTEAGTITATLNWTDASANLSLFLKNPSGTQVASAASTRKPEVITYEATTTGTYKLSVKAVSGSSPYTLSVTHSEPPPPPPPPGEVTFNGSVDAAGTVMMNHTVNVTEPGMITATLDWTDASANLSLFLKNPSGTLVASSASTRKPEVINYDAPTTGAYKFSVKAVSGASTYTLHVTHSQDDPPPPPPPPPTGGEWPEFHHDTAHSGIATDTTIGATNADDLQLHWQTNAGGPAFSSPAVAHSAPLGKTLVYIGNHSGVMAAFDATTGARQWWFKAGSSINSSPAVVNNTVYFGASDDYFYALDASSGALRCKFHTGGVISSSPTIVDPDGSGLVAYIGDNGLTGGDDGGHVWAINAVDPNAAPDCSQKWVFDSYGDPPGSHPETGTWTPMAFGRTAAGRPLVVFGGSSTDNAVYAVDAVTGQRVWRFGTEVFHPDNDVGAGATISAPGVNGFADGVAYVAGKNRIVYALNLLTGAKLWEFRIRDDDPDAGGATRSTAALLGDRLFVGYGEGVYALDAKTGARVWRTEDVPCPAEICPSGPGTQEVISSPAITGTLANGFAMFFGDMAGDVIGVDAATGARLWTYATGGFIYGSPAVAVGKVFIASSDGFLYAFGPGTGAGSSAKPETTLTTPASGATVANTGSVSMTGSASDDQGVQQVFVAVKNKNTNKWWDAASGTWKPVFFENPATLSSPGGTSTNWTFAFPPGDAGGPFFAQAAARDAGGQYDPSVAQTSFTVASLGNPPETTISSPSFAQVFHFPGGQRQSFGITVQGSATDSGGPNPGITRVNVVIKNIEHGEHFCGSAGCAAGDGESTAWSPTYTVLSATLSNPGGASTNWSLTFPTYDHPHKYRIVAWAVDGDGEADQSRATIGRICVRDPGDNACV